MMAHPISNRVYYGFLIFLLTSSASASDPRGPTKDALSFGLGSSSCARWMNNPQVHQAARQWVFGFWSGWNAIRGMDIGQHTDADGIIGAVESVCRSDPSMPLAQAASAAWNDLAVKGR